MARIVITGANRGIGLALARVFKERGDEVIAVVRKDSHDLRTLGVTVIEGIDVAEDASVTGLAERIGKPVDVLVNNAGIATYDKFDNFDFRKARDQFEVNALGPLRVTRELLPLLGKGAKVAIITSRSGSIGDNGSSGMYGYRMSKAAVNMAGVNLALDLKPRGIAVALLHPGMVKTDMGGGPQAVEAIDSARRLAARVDEMRVETSGQFLHAEGHVLPW